MHNPTLAFRIYVVSAMIVAVLALGYPTAFVVVHGWNFAAWSPNLPLHPTAWFQDLSKGHINVVRIFVTLNSAEIVIRKPKVDETDTAADEAA
jgi:hypothetical protein